MLLSCSANLFGQASPQFDKIETLPIASSKICDRLTIKYTNITAPTPNGWPAIIHLSFEIFTASPSSTVPYNPWNYSNTWNQSTLFPCYINGTNMGSNPFTRTNTTVTPIVAFTLLSCTFNNMTNTYDIAIQSNAGGVNAPIETLELEFMLDCSLLNDALANKKIIYRLGYNANPIIPVLNSPTQFNIPLPIQFTKLMPVNLTNQTFQVPVNYGTNKDWVFSYQNTGGSQAPIAIIDFYTTACNSYILVSSSPFEFQVSSNSIPGLNWTSFTIPYTLPPIPPNQYLHVKQKVRIDDCMTPCGTLSATLKWKCATPLPGSCTSCQEDITTPLSFNYGTDKVTVSRLLPSNADAMHNNLCMGEVQTWKFKLENTGNTTVKNVSFSLSKLNSAAFVYIEDNSLTVYEDYLSCLPYGFFRYGIQTQFESIPKLELKPNPTKESVTITLLNSNGGIHKIAVFDLSGKVVLVENLQNNLSSHLLDVENLVDGIYTLKISDIESVYVAKLIVIK